MPLLGFSLLEQMLLSTGQRKGRAGGHTPAPLLLPCAVHKSGLSSEPGHGLNSPPWARQAAPAERQNKQHGEGRSWTEPSSGGRGRASKRGFVRQLRTERGRSPGQRGWSPRTAGAQAPHCPHTCSATAASMGPCGTPRAEIPKAGTCA